MPLWSAYNHFSLEKKPYSSIFRFGCARRGASGALNPKSAYAGLNPHLRIQERKSVFILAGHHATDGHEPRQVRKEAAISDADCVAVDPGHGNELWLSKKDSMAGAQPLFWMRNSDCGMWNVLIADLRLLIHSIADFGLQTADFNKINYWPIPNSWRLA